MKICHLLNMPVAKDLFRYAIVESGFWKSRRRQQGRSNRIMRGKFLANLGITEKN